MRDALPPVYELTERACGGDVRRCAGGDVACHEAAARDGYVAISLYAFCRADDVRTELRPSGIVVVVLALALAVAAGAFLVWRRRAAT